MVVNLRRGAPVSAGTTLPSAGGLLRDPSCSQLDPSRTLPMESCCPGVKSCVQSVGAAPKKKKKKKKREVIRSRENQIISISCSELSSVNYGTVLRNTGYLIVPQNMNKVRFGNSFLSKLIKQLSESSTFIDGTIGTDLYPSLVRSVLHFRRICLTWS